MWQRFLVSFLWFKKPRGLQPQAWLITRFFRKGILRPIARLKIFKVEVRGKQHLPKQGGNIIAGNHPSGWDPVIAAGSVDRNVVFFSKAELWRNPVMRFFMNLMGQIPVDRGNRDSGTKAQASGLAVLNYGKKRGMDKGGTIVIFPEGGCTPSEGPDAGVMKRFKVGVYYLALESGAPVIPTALKGTGNMPKARIWHVLRTKRRVRVQVCFGEPMYATDYAGPQEFVAVLRSRVENMLILMNDWK